MFFVLPSVVDMLDFALGWGPLEALWSADKFEDTLKSDNPVVAEKTFFSGRLINQKYIYIYKGIFSCEHQTVPDYLAAAVHSEKRFYFWR